MAKLKVSKLLRKGKFQSRIETSDGHPLVLDHDTDGKPYIGMELDIEASPALGGELRPLLPTDKWPKLLSSEDVL